MANHASRGPEIFKTIRLLLYLCTGVVSLLMSNKYGLFKSYPAIPAIGMMLVILLAIMDGISGKDN